MYKIAYWIWVCIGANKICNDFSVYSVKTCECIDFRVLLIVLMVRISVKISFYGKHEWIFSNKHVLPDNPQLPVRRISRQLYRRFRLLGYENSCSTDSISPGSRYKIIMLLLCFTPIDRRRLSYVSSLFVYFFSKSLQTIVFWHYRIVHCACTLSSEVIRIGATTPHDRMCRRRVSNTTVVRGGDGMIKYTRFPRSPSASFTTHFIQYV